MRDTPGLLKRPEKSEIISHFPHFVTQYDAGCVKNPQLELIFTLIHSRSFTLTQNTGFQPLTPKFPLAERGQLGIGQALLVATIREHRNEFYPSNAPPYAAVPPRWGGCSTVEHGGEPFH
jgi:hypothetical protein